MPKLSNNVVWFLFPAVGKVGSKVTSDFWKTCVMLHLETTQPSLAVRGRGTNAARFLWATWPLIAER